MTVTNINTKQIKDSTVLNEDVDAAAAIAGTKISPDFGSQNVATTGTLTVGAASPAASAILDVTGTTTKGSRPAPLLTTSQITAISSPATGLLVYDTTLSGYYFWTGSVWTALSAAAASVTILNQALVDGNGDVVTDSGNIVYD